MKNKTKSTLIIRSTITLTFILLIIATISAVAISPNGAAAQAEDLTRFHPLTLWTTEFSNEEMWHEDEINWGTIRFPDLNLDGKDDICSLGGQTILCGTARDGSFNNIRSWLSDFQGAPISEESTWRTISYPDVTGDEKADICMRTDKGIYCAVSSGAAFQLLTAWEASSFTDAEGWNTDPSYWGTIRYPDLNGDGAQDLCGRDSVGIRCSFSTGTTFTGSVYWDTSFNNANGWNSHPSYWATIQYPDLNGDDKDDICGRGNKGIACALSNGLHFGPATFWDSSFADETGWKSHESYWETIQFPDLNGDEKADVCGRGSAGIYCGLSDGSSFQQAQLWTQFFADPFYKEDPSYWKTIKFDDVNMDGNDDICGRTPEGLVCLLSTGTEFSEWEFWQRGFADIDGWKEDESMWGTLQFTQINRDGLPAICGRRTDGIVCAPAAVNNIPLAIQDLYNTSKNSELVVSAENGVIANDSDPDQEQLVSLIIKNPLNGQLTLNLDGSFAYQPNQDFLGIDTFSYILRDEGHLFSNITEVNIEVVVDNPTPTMTPTTVPTATPTATPTVTPPTPGPNPMGFTLYLPFIKG